MADKLKVFTLSNLQQYDGLIKGYVDAADAKSLKTVTITGNKVNFYRTEEPIAEGATPAYSIELPETDISGLIEKLKNATAGDVVIANADGTISDSGVKLTDLATAANLKTVSDKVDVINNTETGILAQAKKYTDDEIDALSAEGGAIKANADAIAKLNGDATTEGSVAKAVKDSADAINKTIGTVTEGKTVVDMIADAKKESTYDDSTVKANIGDLTTLKTTEKGSLVGAVNEVKDTVDANATAAKVTVSTETITDGYLKSYTIKQGETQLAVIDIPKDLVVTAGEVVTNPEGQAEGTYVKLTIANQEAPIYINVKDLVDAYTAEKNAKQIQLVVSDTNEISATIVASSVGTTELADGAVTTAKIVDANVTTAKIADANVTAAKLSADAKALFDAAGSAKALADGQVATNKADIATLQGLVGEGYEAITEAEINALFTTTEA